MGTAGKQANVARTSRSSSSAARKCKRFFFEVWFIKILAGVYKNFGWGVCNRQNVIGHKFFSVVLIGQNYTRG